MSCLPIHCSKMFHSSNRSSEMRKRSNLVIEDPSALTHVNFLLEVGTFMSSISLINELKPSILAILISLDLPFFHVC